jgi:GNAT superfamily N-acetyltransferase
VYGGRYPLAITLGDVGGLAESDDAIVGSMFSSVDAWNHSMELGRTVVHPDYRRYGLAQALSEYVLEQAETVGVEIFWGYVRSTPILRISEKLGMHVVGYFPGAHKVDEREVHLMVMRLTDRARTRRVRPHADVIHCLSGVRRVSAEMMLPRTRAPYPPDTVVSSLSENVTVRGAYHESDRSLILTMTDPSGPIAPEYIQVAALTDKTTWIQHALDRKFHITAFLPAWVEKGERRYDAVLLTCALSAPAFHDPAFQLVVREFEDGFQHMEPPSLTSLPKMPAHGHPSSRHLRVANRWD